MNPNGAQLRFGALVLAYNQEDYIAYCLRSLAPHAEVIVVLFTKHPWVAYNPTAAQQFSAHDNTGEILAQLTREIPQLAVVEGSWSCEEDMRNDGLRELRRRGIDVCLTVDADEIYPDGGMAALKGEIVRHNTSGTAFYVRARHCFRRLNFVVDSRWRAPGARLWEPERTPVALHLNRETRFQDCRHSNAVPLKLPEGHFFWHFGYVLSDQRMWEKIHTFAHAHEIVPDWYQEKWLDWTPETRNLFYKEPRERWPHAQRIDPAELPAMLRDHPFYPQPPDIPPGPSHGSTTGGRRESRS